MKVLVTGSSNGIGKAITEKFLKEGHKVYGIDIDVNKFTDNKNYIHFQRDIRSKILPPIKDVEILINNAGTQNQDESDIAVNLNGTINITEKYGVQPKIKSILFMASASARSGAEFPHYAASKGGMVAYMKNVALRICKYGATSNSISAGGVTTALNAHILENENLKEAVLKETLLNRWASPEEIAEFTYFFTIINKSMTAQDILIDNGEDAKSNFIW